MSGKAFSLMLLVVVVLGGAVGGALFAFSGDSEETVVAGTTATPSSGDSTDNLSSDSITTGASAPGEDTAPFGRGRLGGAGGLPIEPIVGTIAGVSKNELVVTTADTGSETNIIVPPETPVRLSETAGDTDALTAGATVFVLLQRNEDGSINATSLTIGALPGGGGRTGAVTGGTGDGDTGFNAVTGTVTAFSNGTLTIDTADGPVDATVADDTPVQITVAFADATDSLPIGSTITVIGQRDEAGTYAPITIASGDFGGFAGRGGFGGAVGGRRGQLGEGGRDGGFTIIEAVPLP